MTRHDPSGSASEQLLAQVAWDYYINQRGQRDIARHLGVSSATVSRLLKRARQQGVVQVSIPARWGLAVELERALRTTWELEWVRVLPRWLIRGAPGDSLGQAAAFYLNGAIGQVRTLALGWGRTIAHLGTYAAGHGAGAVVEMVGTFVASSRYEAGLSLAASLAHAYGMEAMVLSAPAMTETPEQQRLWLEHPQIRAVLERAREADLAVVGVGPVRPESTLAQLGLVEADLLADIGRRGAVGEILGRFFDSEGRTVTTPLDDRLVGLTLADVQGLPRVMAVAAGPEKVDALRGALAGRLVTHLVTDEDTARALTGNSPPHPGFEGQ